MLENVQSVDTINKLVDKVNDTIDVVNQLGASSASKDIQQSLQSAQLVTDNRLDVLESATIDDASPTTKGLVQLATAAEVIAGTNNTKAVSPLTLRSEAVSANVANRAVRRDASGNFSASVITATLNGNASTATTADYADYTTSATYAGVAATVQVDTSTADDGFPFVLSPVQFSGEQILRMAESGGTYNPSTNTASISINGNALSATRLLTPRTIQLIGDVLGTAIFDGSANTSIMTTIDSTSSGFEKSFAAKGYQKLPSGLIVQWTSGTRGAVSWPVVFPNACLSAVSSFTAVSNGGSTNTHQGISFTATGCTLSAGADNNNTQNIIAVGY